MSCCLREPFYVWWNNKHGMFFWKLGLFCWTQAISAWSWHHIGTKREPWDQQNTTNSGTSSSPVQLAWSPRQMKYMKHFCVYYYPSHQSIYHWMPLAFIFIIIWKTFVNFLTCNSQTLNSHISLFQEIIKRREWISHFGLLPTSVFLRNGTQFFRSCYSRVV